MKLVRALVRSLVDLFHECRLSDSALTMRSVGRCWTIDHWMLKQTYPDEAIVIGGVAGTCN